MLQEEKSRKEATNVTEKFIHYELFITKVPSKIYNRKIFIAYYGATSHMVTNEVNMINLQDVEIRVTVGYSGTLIGTKNDNCRGYQKDDRKLHLLILYDMDVIPGLHENIIISIQALKNGFQVTSEV